MTQTVAWQRCMPMGDMGKVMEKVVGAQPGPLGPLAIRSGGLMPSRRPTGCAHD